MDENILDGLFFLSKSDEGKTHWQGRVLGKVEKSLYVVQLYSWMTGAETCVRLVALEQMLEWDFYHTHRDWNEAAKRETNE